MKLVGLSASPWAPSLFSFLPLKKVQNYDFSSWVLRNWIEKLGLQKQALWTLLKGRCQLVVYLIEVLEESWKWRGPELLLKGWKWAQYKFHKIKLLVKNQGVFKGLEDYERYLICWFFFSYHKMNKRWESVNRNWMPKQVLKVIVLERRKLFSEINKSWIIMVKARLFIGWI